MEKGNTVSEDYELVEIFSNDFTNIVKKLDIPREDKAKMNNDTIINAIKTFDKQPTIKKIKGH